MELCYQLISGHLYAKIPGRSVRENGTVHKKDVVYLGRVIDKEHNVFCNRERGIYTYDPVTNTYGAAEETYVSHPVRDKRKKVKLILDFGDAFFVDQLIHQTGYDKVLENIPYKNKDTLYSMVQYYILCSSANDHAHIWYDGSYARVLYPNADLTSQRISDFLRSLGDEEKVSAFFDAHVAWIKTQCDDPAVLADSTGLPNNIHFPLTAVSNHNGKISREVRLTTIVQRDSGYPLLFRETPGNIVDMTTITRTLNEVFLRDVAVDFVIMDAGYYTNENVDELYAANVDFLTRLSPKYGLYKSIVNNNFATLRSKENLVQYKGRYVYIKRVDCAVGEKKHPAYAYLGYDIDRASDESHKALRKARNDKKAEATLHKTLEEAGLFIMVSSLAFEAEDILPAYYTRQLIEQYFDVSKGASNLTPLRIHSEESLRGHLVLSMIAATLNVYIQNKMNAVYSNREEIFMTLRNQKCILHESKITTSEPQKQANKFYNRFKIECPLYFEKKSGEFKPQYHLPKINKDEV